MLPFHDQKGFIISHFFIKNSLLNVTYSSSLLLRGNFNSAVVWFSKKKKLVFATYLEVEQTKENKDNRNLLYWLCPLSSVSHYVLLQ